MNFSSASRGEFSQRDVEKFFFCLRPEIFRDSTCAHTRTAQSRDIDIRVLK